MSEPCETGNNSNLWWIIVLVGIIIIVIVILVGLLTRRSGDEPAVCKSAEYPSIAENMSCDPNVVEVSLTASDNEVQILNGGATKLYNYNESFPGPLIEAKKGDELIVHFFNDISEPSTITWHGLQGNANMDGSSISQLPVMPGESFDYRFELNTAGLFWYHSDINPREQVHKGLYGVILVKDYEDIDCLSLPTTEKVLAFSDLQLNSDNQVDIFFSDNDCERASQQVNGILGNVLLTNGVLNGCINITKNEPVRLRMVNCATDRFMKIQIENHDMLRIGGDQGLLEKPILIKEDNGLILTTGERADVVFVPRQDNIKVYTSSNVRGIQKVEKDDCGNCELLDQVDKSEERLLLVTFLAGKGSELEELEIPLELKKINRIKVDQCTPVIPVNYGNFPPDEEGNIDFYAFKKCDEGIPFDELNKKEAPIVFEDGVYIIEVVNRSVLPNNFYLHGFSFQHLDTLYLSSCDKERVVNKVLENKDTIYIPAKPDDGYKSKTVVRLAVDFNSKGRDIVAFGKHPTENRSGGWIMQSHILTHAQLGQQSFVQIVGECDRRKYSSYSGYTNTYSDYSSGDYKTCLTRPSNSRYSGSGSKYLSSSSYHSSSSFGSKRISSSLSEITKSLINCSCGSGISVSSCSCSKGENSRKSKYSDSSEKTITYSAYKPPSPSSVYDDSSTHISSYDSLNNSYTHSYDDSSSEYSRYD